MIGTKRGHLSNRLGPPRIDSVFQQVAWTRQMCINSRCMLVGVDTWILCVYKVNVCIHIHVLPSVHSIQ